MKIIDDPLEREKLEKWLFDNSLFLPEGIKHICLNLVSNLPLSREIEEKNFDEALGWLEETKRVELITKALSEYPMLKDIKDLADDSKTNLLKGFSQYQSVDIQEMKVESQTINEIIKSPRNTSNDVRYDGNFKITNYDSDSSELLKIIVKNTDSNVQFVVGINEEALTPQQKATILKAVSERITVFAKFNANKIGEKIVDATLIEISES
jgi:hypothetical protein